MYLVVGWVGRKKEQVDEGFGLHIYVFFFVCLCLLVCFGIRLI